MTFRLIIGEQSIAIDVVEAKRALDTIESRVGLKTTSPTQELLAAVAGWLVSRFGVSECSPTVAWCVWWSLCEHLDRLRAQMEAVAEIGHWLHIDATSMRSEQKAGLLQNLDRIKAQSLLHNGRYDGTDYAGVYRLVLLATGDEQQARRAQAMAAERYVDAKTGSH